MAKRWGAKFKGIGAGDYYVVESLDGMYSWEFVEGGARCVGAEFATATAAARALLEWRGEAIPARSGRDLVERCRGHDLRTKGDRAA